MILATHGIVGSQIVQFTGLLDDYSGAAAAYSLRLLSSTYTGDAIEVRRASDNTKEYIGFVDNELDVTTLESFCSGTDGFVATWYDQSGNGNNASQSSASAQPQIVSSGSVILDSGKSTLQFDGSDDGLSFDSSSMDIGSLSSLVVGRYNTINNMLFAISSSIGDKRYFAPYASSGAFRFGYASNTTALSVTGDTSRHLFTMMAGSTLGNMEAWVDTSSLGTATLDSGIDPRNGIGNVSNVLNANCNVQEVIVYNSDQSSNRTGIETNINDFYSIYT